MSKLANRSSTMTLKKLIGVGLAGLAALAVAVLLIDPSLAQTAAGGHPRLPALSSSTRATTPG
jgi:hypothetical protein